MTLLFSAIYATLPRPMIPYPDSLPRLLLFAGALSESKNDIQANKYLDYKKWILITGK